MVMMKRELWILYVAKGCSKYVDYSLQGIEWELAEQMLQLKKE